jgi:hypothetical protein
MKNQLRQATPLQIISEPLLEELGCRVLKTRSIWSGVAKSQCRSQLLCIAHLPEENIIWQVPQRRRTAERSSALFPSNDIEYLHLKTFMAPNGWMSSSTGLKP